MIELNMLQDNDKIAHHENIINNNNLATKNFIDNPIISQEDLEGKTFSTNFFENDSITRNKILDGEITNSKMGVNSVNNDNFINGEITRSKLSPEIQDLLNTSNISLDINLIRIYVEENLRPIDEYEISDNPNGFTIVLYKE